MFMKSRPAISCDLGPSSWNDVLFTQMESWAELGPRENLKKLRIQASSIFFFFNHAERWPSVMERMKTLESDDLESDSSSAPCA